MSNSVDEDLRPVTICITRGRLAQILGTLRNVAIDKADQAQGADEPHARAQLEALARAVHEHADVLAASIVPEKSTGIPAVAGHGGFYVVENAA